MESRSFGVDFKVGFFGLKKSGFGVGLGEKVPSLGTELGADFGVETPRLGAVLGLKCQISWWIWG